MSTFTEFILEHNRVPTIDDQAWRYKGWLLWYMQRIAEEHPAIPDRWSYLQAIHVTGEFPDAPIPRIEFNAHPEGKQAITDTIERIARRFGGGWGWEAFSLTVDWLAWGLGTGDAYPEKIDDETAADLYRGIDYGPILLHPYDYLGEIAAEKHAGGWNPNAFFPTPHPVCEAMISMTMADHEREDTRDPRGLTVCDPALGTGRMLLHASNHAMFLYGQDIDPMMIKITKINGALYAPWLVVPPPAHLKGSEVTVSRSDAPETPRKRPPPPRKAKGKRKPPPRRKGKRKPPPRKAKKRKPPPKKRGEG